MVNYLDTKRQYPDVSQLDLQVYNVIDYKSFLTTAQLVGIGREYWCYDAIDIAQNAPLPAALLIVRKHYKDIVWC